MVADLGGLDVIVPLFAVLMAFACMTRPVGRSRDGFKRRTRPIFPPRPGRDPTRGVAA